MLASSEYWSKVKSATNLYFIATRNNHTHEYQLLKHKLRHVKPEDRFQVIYLDMLDYARIKAFQLLKEVNS